MGAPPKLLKAAPDPRVRLVAALRPRDIQFREHLAELNTHIVDLCHYHRVTVTPRAIGADSGCAHLEQRTIECPPVTDEVSYSIALHELGHVLDPDADSRQYPHVVKTFSHGPGLVAIEAEAAAWEWARAKALRWTQPMHRRLVAGLAVYAADAAMTRDERHSVTACIMNSATALVEPITFRQLDLDLDRVRGVR